MIIFTFYVFFGIMEYRDKKIPITSIFFINFLYGAFIVFFSFLLFLTDQFFIFRRQFEYTYICFIPFVIYGISKIHDKGRLYKNIVVPTSLVILVIGGNIMLMEPNQRFYYIERSVLSTDNYIFNSPRM